MMSPGTTTSTHSVSTFETRQRAIGKFVNSKIAPLQHDYTTVTAGSSGARAHLAMLRHGFDDGEVRWLNVGYDIFADWPPEELGDPADERGFGTAETLNAIGTALQMYALHQQSKSQGMAWFPLHNNDNDANEVVLGHGSSQGAAAGSRSHDRWKHSFGAACRVLDGPKIGTEITPVRRKLQAMEYAPDFEGVRTNMMSLIRRMRSENVTLDYNGLAQDLFRLQFPSRHSSVFKRWGQEYFSSFDQQDGTETTEA